MGFSPWAIAQIWRGRPALVVLGLDLAAAGLDLGSHGPRRRWSRALLGKKQWAGSVKTEGVNAGSASSSSAQRNEGRAVGSQTPASVAKGQRGEGLGDGGRLQVRRPGAAAIQSSQRALEWLGSM